MKRLTLGIIILAFSSLSVLSPAFAEHFQEGFLPPAHPWAPVRSESTFNQPKSFGSQEHDCDAADRACMSQCGGPRMENYSCWHRCMISYDCDS